VLGVAPTFCETEGNMEALSKLPERVREEIAATTTSALGRVGVPDDIARAVLFCASDMSLFMTGSTLLVDAGETARIGFKLLRVSRACCPRIARSMGTERPDQQSHRFASVHS